MQLKLSLGIQKDVSNNRNETITLLKQKIMRTLNSNCITEKLSTSKAYTWNSKRRYRK